MRCIVRLSVQIAPFAKTFAIDAIRSNANSNTLRLDASSKVYTIPVSSFSMLWNCFNEISPSIGFQKASEYGTL